MTTLSEAKVFENRKPVSECCGASIRRDPKESKAVYCTKCKQRFRLKTWWMVPGEPIEQTEGKIPQKYPSAKDSA